MLDLGNPSYGAICTLFGHDLTCIEMMFEVLEVHVNGDVVLMDPFMEFLWL